MEHMSPEDRAVVESLIATGDVDPDEAQALLKPEQQTVFNIIKEDAAARARQMLLERQHAKGAIGPHDVKDVIEELKTQYRM